MAFKAFVYKAANLFGVKGTDQLWSSQVEGSLAYVLFYFPWKIFHKSISSSRHFLRIIIEEQGRVALRL